MDKLEIIGGNKLFGDIAISGAKNSALKIIVAAILSNGKTRLSNVPKLADVRHLCELLDFVGASHSWDGDILQIDSSSDIGFYAPYDLVRKMRASFNLLGPLLRRNKKAKVSLPGGCAIGSRPVNLHLDAFKKIGVNIEIEEGYVIANYKKLHSSVIEFPFISVGATEHLLMTLASIPLEFKLVNCAKEPEIIDLANFLVKMGAKIEGAGTNEISIFGTDNLSSCEYEILPDRIETGSYLLTVCLCGGEVTISNTDPKLLGEFWDVVLKLGYDIKYVDNKIIVKSDASAPEPISIETNPFPGFATDLQAVYMTLLCTADIANPIIIKENIFENRFMHVPELIRMGADISINGNQAIINKKINFKAAEVMATDLRASMSLVMAALKADGKSTINRIYHLDRGFEMLEKKLGACGANIKRVN